MLFENLGRDDGNRRAMGYEQSGRSDFEDERLTRDEMIISGTTTKTLDLKLCGTRN